MIVPQEPYVPKSKQAKFFYYLTKTVVVISIIVAIVFIVAYTVSDVNNSSGPIPTVATYVPYLQAILIAFFGMGLVGVLLSMWFERDAPVTPEVVKNDDAK